MTIIPAVFVAFLATISMLAAQQPTELASSDWSGIRAAHERQLHAIVANPDGTHQARNPGQAWVTRFDARGFSVTPDVGGWSWGVELLGHPDVTAVRYDGGKISYVRGDGLTEWFVNDTRGLEQGWTLDRRPDAAAPPQLDLAVRGSLRPQVSADGTSVAFLNEAGGTTLTYGGLKAWDADGKIVPVRFAEGTAAGAALGVVVDDTGARYPLTIDPLAYQTYLKASNTGADDQFGKSIAISGDTVVIGAPNEDCSATGVNTLPWSQWNNLAPNSGAVYVFVRSGTAWTQQAYLKASNTGASDNFGISVAISGNTVLVGAGGEASGVVGSQADNSAYAAGATYVFVRSGTSWSQQAYLKASNSGANDRFGGTVAIAGDTVVVGASGEASNATGANGVQTNNSFSNAGAAYVFVRSGTSWNQQAYLKASNTDASDLFGCSVAISGNTVVVGASGESSSATGANGVQTNNFFSNAGAAYVFVRSGIVWSQQAYLKASNTGALDLFGCSVAISGETVVVGACAEDSYATGIDGFQGDNYNNFDSGAAYAFVRAGATWSQQAYLKSANTSPSSQFGYSVAIAGDTVAVGSIQKMYYFGTGSANVFVRSGTSWSHLTYLTETHYYYMNQFGYSVAISGDTVVVGDPGDASAATGIGGNRNDNSAYSSGAVYVYSSARPSNDDFVNRINLGNGATATATGNLLGGTGEYVASEPDLEDWQVTGDFNRDATVWYQWTAPAGSQWVTLTVSGPQVPAVVSAYTGTQISGLTTVALNRQVVAGAPQLVTFPVTPGTTYQIRVAFWWEDYHYEPGLMFNLGLETFGNPATVAQYLARGRALLGQGNYAVLAQAAADFTAALALSPTNEEAHLLRALTNLLRLEGEPAFGQALGDLGASREGSLLGMGTVTVPEDTAGYRVYAGGARSSILIDWVKNQLLPRLATVRSDLAAVTSNDFRVVLNPGEMGATGALVDKGDVLVFTAVTHGLEMLFNLLFTYDLDVSLNAMVNLDKNGQLDAQHVLASTSSLLKFAASDRRAQFAAALRAMQQDYAAASDFIRNRRGDPVGLLTEELSTDQTRETEIRDNLASAVNSLNGEVTHQGLRVNLSRLVATAVPMRDWMPEFRGNEVMFRTLPDPTLDGILPDASGNRIYQMVSLWGMSQYAEEFGDYLRIMTGTDDPSGDSDGDGRDNFAEWLALSNPITPDTVWQDFTRSVIAPGKNEVRLTFARRRDLREWKLRVAVSDDLVGWDRTESQIEMVGTPVDNGDGFTETVTYRLKDAAALANRKFMRVEVAPK